jgi:hypothetical protein
LTEAETIERLTNERKDVVVRGPSWHATREEARRLTNLAFGGYEEDAVHEGRMALPHFHPPGRFPRDSRIL